MLKKTRHELLPNLFRYNGRVQEDNMLQNGKEKEAWDGAYGVKLN